MQYHIKQINIKNRPYYFLNDMISLKNFDPNLLKITKLSFRNVFNVKIYDIKYITMKSLDHVNINNEDFFYLIFNSVDGYIEESNGIKYLVFASTDENKEALKKYTKLWNETKNQIRATNDGEPVNYRKDFMKLRFESDGDLTLGKALNIPSMIIGITSVFQ